MKYALFFFLVVALCVNVSCVNLEPKPDNTKLYVLGPVSSEVVFASKTSPRAIYVSRPSFPGYLAGNKIKFRKDSGELMSLKSARWGEDLDEGISRSIAEFLSAEGSRLSIDGYYPWTYQSREIPRLDLEFHQLSALSDGSIEFVAKWSLNHKDVELASGTYAAEDLSWSQGSASSLVAAYNTGLRLLAAHIGESL